MKKAILTALLGATFGVVVLSLLVSKHFTSPEIVKAQTPPTWSARGFYLTPNLFPPSGAVHACTAGYHMASLWVASLWEIFNVSTLKYNTQLGSAQADSGSGPPSNQSGWIRTGWSASKNSTPGQANCNGWTDNSYGDYGSAVYLLNSWPHTSVTAEYSADSPIAPWANQFQAVPQNGINAYSCNVPLRVWCVQD